METAEDGRRGWREALRRHGASAVVLAGAAGLYVVAGLSLALDDRAGLSGGPRAEAAMLPGPVPMAPAPPDSVPEPEPLDFRAMDVDQARAWNASVPLADLPNPAARAFTLAAASAGDRARAIECLTSAIYYEAAIEPVEGQRAVAQVVLNRVRHPAYPSSVCGVVFEGAERRTGCQFTFTCDGSLARAPHPALWRRAEAIAEAALAGDVYAPVGWATHYHTDWVVPYWAQNLVKSAKIGTHIFYRWTGGWGRARAFASRHAGIEPSPRRVVDSVSGPATNVIAEAAPAIEIDPAVAASGATIEIDGKARQVVRRYQPLERDSARAVIAERSSEDATLSASQRWALTGVPPDAKQAPLGAPNMAAPAPEVAR